MRDLHWGLLYFLRHLSVSPTDCAVWRPCLPTTAFLLSKRAHPRKDTLVTRVDRESGNDWRNDEVKQREELAAERRGGVGWLHSNERMVLSSGDV